MANYITCPICSNSMNKAFQAKVLAKYLAQYEVCNSCGFLRAHNPHWLEEAYTSAIASTDTGLVMRNVVLANKISRVLFYIFGERGQGKYLDVAGGYGMLTRMMRDFGFDFYWKDKYCENLVALGFEYSQDLGACRAVTAIEVLEHVVDPLAFIHEALNDGGAKTIIFTTELYDGLPPEPDDWWYYSFSTGQHIGFFQHRTLEVIAKNLKLNYVSANGLHIFSDKKINKIIFKLITNRYFSLFMPVFIRKRLGTKMLTDHEVMIRKINKMSKD